MSGGEQLRVSQHSGRQGSAKHNDRSFMVGRSNEWRLEHAPHIDTTRTVENVVWTWDGQTDIETSERTWYEQEYQQAQERTNDRYRREGHADRCKTTDQLYEGRLTRPEEMILQVGTQADNIDPAEFAQAVDRYLDKLDEWDTAHGGHMHILSIALHVDESSPHLHIRRVWDYRDGDGLTRLGQARALEAAGVPLPDPTKPTGRYNNRKMSFDSMARGWWQECCREQGWDIETESRPGMRHKDKRDYIRDQIAAELDTARQEATAADRIRQNATRQAEDAQQRAQEQAAEFTRQATQERDRAVQERDKARLQRDGLRRERDAIAKDVQQWIDKASDSRGVYLTGYLATERMAEKLAALMEYQEGWMLKSLDETMDRYISSIPAPMMPDSMREMLQEHREQDAQLETHKRVARELTDELEL